MVRFGKFFLASMVALLSAGPVAAEQGCITSKCHAGFAEKKTTHPADSSCTACHVDSDDKHSKGGGPPVLGKKLCGSCHDAILAHRYKHSPVTETSCQLCHNPHGDMKNLLLSVDYSTQLFIDYNDEAYTLCFSCHKRDLLMFPDTSFSTGFRNGNNNLHYRHVNMAFHGRSCKLCHGIHGAEQPHLLADTVAFGNWRMPVKYTATENGGSCSPGCHEHRQYDRKASPQAPVPAPAPAPAEKPAVDGASK